MPDEALIIEIENLLSEVIDLGGQNERSQIVPNLTVQDANPTGLSGFVIVSDDRDGDNILARKVGSVIYSDNDEVNVMFLRGAEPIAFQQGSESSNNGIWEIVPATSTDIFYDKGDVGIGNAAPTTALDVTGTVTITDDILHAGDTDTKISFTIDDIELTAGNLSMLKLTEAGQDVVRLGPGSGDVDINFNGDMFLRGSDGFFGIGTTAPLTLTEIKKDQNTSTQLRITNNNDHASALAGFAIGTHITNDNQGFAASVYPDASTQVGPGGMSLNGWAQFRSDSQLDGFVLNVSKATGEMVFAVGNTQAMRIHPTNRRVMVGTVTSLPDSKFYIDQQSTTTALPVLTLDQANVDEPFIEFVGTAAAADLTRSIVDEGDVTTATRIGWYKIEIDDIGNQVTDGDYFVPFYSLT